MESHGIPSQVQSAPVQIDVIEAQKENIEPLHSGRSASSLARAFSIPVTEQREEIIAERDNHEKAIQESDELDDPLQPYLDYIKWATEKFPSGGGATVSTSDDGPSNPNASGMAGLLEERRLHLETLLITKMTLDIYRFGCGISSTVTVLVRCLYTSIEKRLGEG